MILVGEDRYLLDEILAGIADGKEVIRMRTVVQALGAVHSSIFKDRIYLVSEDSAFLKQDELWGMAQAEPLLIIHYNKLDKRTTFFRNNDVKEFDNLSESKSIVIFANKHSVSLDTAKYFFELNDGDYGRVDNDLKMARLLERHALTSTDGFFQEKINKNAYFFKFIDSLCSKNKREAVYYERKLRQTDQNVFGLLSLLYTKHQTMLLLKTAPKNIDLPKALGIPYWQLKDLMQAMKKQPVAELERKMKFIMNATVQLKRGQISERFIPPICVVEMCK